MKTSRLRAGFTLIELLVVIAIIGILAAMLLPVFGKVKVKTQIRQAQMEMSQLNMAIQGYQTDNNQFPCSVAAKNAAAATGDDYTYGGTFATPTGTLTVGIGDNRDVMAILLAKEYDMQSPPNPTVNLGNSRNPQRTPYLNPKMVSDTSSPGVGIDLVYRDPWGMPYVISMDFNFDNKTRDAFYRQQNVSQKVANSGWFGLFNSQAADGNSDYFEASAPVMIWSAGPDKMIDPNPVPPGTPGYPWLGSANYGANKDNVLSWKQ